MLDQSFSAENFKEIFHIENRKGNIDRQILSEEYIDLILKIKDLKKELKLYKAKYKNATIDKQHYINVCIEKDKEIDNLKEEKDRVLYEQLKKVSERVNHSSFKFNFYTNVKRKKTTYELLPNSDNFYAIKQLQYNIRQTFGVKQADRYQILKQIKLLLSDNFPKYIIRTDIDSFYESIPQNKLLKKIETNTLLNYQSKKMISSILSEFERLKDEKIGSNIGIPRGVGISAYLCELYMRDIDNKIKALNDVVYYARYVDDIFIVIVPSKESHNIDKYFQNIQTIIEANDLKLKTKESGKTILLDLCKQKSNFEETFTYLGYKITIKDKKETEKKKNDLIQYISTFGISDDRIKKYTHRLEIAFKEYSAKSKFNERDARKKLYNCLKFLTGNTNLMSSKKGIKIGVYYSNSLLEDAEHKDLKKLDGILSKTVNDFLNPYEKLGYNENSLNKFRQYICQTFSFTEGFRKLKFHDFTIDEFKELKKLWKDEEA